MVICLALCLTVHAQWSNALKPTGKPGPALTLVKNGKPMAVIQIPAQPSGPERKAAADLQQWLDAMTGASLPIGRQKAKVTIVLRTDSSLGEEGYSIQGDKRRLVLSGGTKRGVPNAVYALLEEDLGCRFYTRDSIRLAKTNTLIVAAVPRKYAPALKLRDPFYACAFDAVWSLRNRSNAPDAPVPEDEGGHMDYGPMFVHTATQILPPDKYFREHPDYFAQKADHTPSAAQLCPTHPELAKIATEYVRTVLKAKPHTEILSISKNDNTEVCHCERCTKLREAEGSDMANQLFLVNQVADAIAEEHPDVIIDTLAYLETIKVPRTVRPHKNVAIRLCNDAVGAWSQPFTPAEQCEVAAIARSWGQAHNRIYVWDYNVNFSHYLAPMPNLDVMASNIRFWIRNNAEGVMLQGGFQGQAERDELKSWVTAKLLWNPNWNETALVNDFIWGHYRTAAPAMQLYEALLASLRVKFTNEMTLHSGGIRYGMDSVFFPKDFIERAAGLFEQAKAQAAGDPTVLRRVERAELPILYVQCVRGPEFMGKQSFARALDDFERIARRENIQYLQEGSRDFEPKLAAFKKKLETSP